MPRSWRASMGCLPSWALAMLRPASRMASVSASMAGAELSLSFSRCEMASTDIVGWFADIGLADRPHVGGKGGSLGELQRAGIDVPPGFVVKTGAFERFVRALEREAPVRAPVEAL